MKPIPAIA
jgi:hypothetical protein